MWAVAHTDMQASRTACQTAAWPDRWDSKHTCDRQTSRALGAHAFLTHNRKGWGIEGRRGVSPGQLAAAGHEDRAMQDPMSGVFGRGCLSCELACEGGWLERDPGCILLNLRKENREFLSSTGCWPD